MKLLFFFCLLLVAIKFQGSHSAPRNVINLTVGQIALYNEAGSFLKVYGIDALRTLTVSIHHNNHLPQDNVLFFVLLI